MRRRRSGPRDSTVARYECPDEFRGLEGPGAHELFTVAQVWFLVSDAEFVHPDDTEDLTAEEQEIAETYQADPAHVIHSLQGECCEVTRFPSGAFLGRQMAAGAMRSLEAGDQVLLGFGSFGVFAAVSVGDDDVSFLGLCAEENYGPSSSRSGSVANSMARSGRLPISVPRR